MSVLQCDNVPTTHKKWLFCQFCVWLWGYDQPISHAQLWVSKISGDVTNTSLAVWKNEHQWWSCDASVLTNNGISMQQHFWNFSWNVTFSATYFCELTLCYSNPWWKRPWKWIFMKLRALIHHSIVTVIIGFILLVVKILYLIDWVVLYSSL